MQYGFLLATIEIFVVVTFLLIKFSPRDNKLAFSDHISKGLPYYMYLCGGLLYLLLSLGTFLDSSFSALVKSLWFLLCFAYIGVVVIPRRGVYVVPHDIAARTTGALLFLLSVVMLFANHYSILVQSTSVITLAVLGALIYSIEVKRTEKTKYLYMQSAYFYAIHIILLMLVYFR